jgi:type VI protein secretion system component VasF
MNAYTGLFSAWGLVTVGLVLLLIYRSRLERQESDWISLTGDEREERAIKTQTMIEMKTRKLTLPIRALGAASVVLLLVILVYWIYTGTTTAPPP